MALPSSGTLSLNNIRTELGVPSQAPMSLRSASIGTYATINTCSPSYPNGTSPYAISEWYGYCHSCACFSDITSDPNANSTSACCSIYFNPDPTVGNRDTFCNSTTLTNPSYGSFSTGTYFIAYGSVYVQVSITNGNNTATVTSSCTGCPSCPTPTPTPTRTSTPTPTPTRTPTPTPTTIVSYLFCLGYNASDCGLACDDYYANCGPF